jgi:hypothetical protein
MIPDKVLWIGNWIKYNLVKDWKRKPLVDEDLDLHEFYGGEEGL